MLGETIRSPESQKKRRICRHAKKKCRKNYPLVETFNQLANLSTALPMESRVNGLPRNISTPFFKARLLSSGLS